MKYGMGVRLVAALSFAVLAQVPAAAQSASIRARITGGDGGKCTFEVDVDGIAEVEIRGGQGYLRTITGSRANWRRLECTEPLPGKPYDFQFKGVDGRGRQDLVRDPNSNHGTAIIRVEDPQGGREGYTGDMTWNGGGWQGATMAARAAVPGGRFERWSWGGSGGSAAALGRSGGSNGGAWDNRGWQNDWGRRIDFGGQGSGNFQRNGGPYYNLRSVKITVVPGGDVTARFDTNVGPNTMSFSGRITKSIPARSPRISRAPSTETAPPGLRGTMPIKMDSSGNRVRPGPHQRRRRERLVQPELARLAQVIASIIRGSTAPAAMGRLRHRGPGGGPETPGPGSRRGVLPSLPPLLLPRGDAGAEERRGRRGPGADGHAARPPAHPRVPGTGPVQLLAGPHRGQRVPDAAADRSALVLRGFR